MVQADVFREKSGISYRQLDHWTTRGYLKPRDAHPGAGAMREWPTGEVAVAKRILDRKSVV